MSKIFYRTTAPAGYKSFKPLEVSESLAENFQSMRRCGYELVAELGGSVVKVFLAGDEYDLDTKIGTDVEELVREILEEKKWSR